jgi:hypothetical protein
VIRSEPAINANCREELESKRLRGTFADHGVVRKARPAKSPKDELARPEAPLKPHAVRYLAVSLTPEAGANDALVGVRVVPAERAIDMLQSIPSRFSVPVGLAKNLSLQAPHSGRSEMRLSTLKIEPSGTFAASRTPTPCRSSISGISFRAVCSATGPIP